VIPPARLRVGIWLGFVIACAIIVARSQYGADLAAFLPSSPSPTQRFLVDELREGVVSRLVLVGIEGGEQGKLAALSQSLAARLEKEAGPDPTARVARAYSLLYQRPPTRHEIGAAARFLLGRETDHAAWAQYSQALLGSNEMQFVD